MSFPPALAELDLTLQQLLDETSTEALQVEQTERPPFLMDPSEQASRERRGRSGLTAQEGRRRKHFHSTEDLVWPVPWNGQPWRGAREQNVAADPRVPRSYSSEILGYLNALAFRVMREHGVAPTEPTTLRDVRSSAPHIETVSEMVWTAARKAGAAYLTDEMKPKRGVANRNGITWDIATGYVTYDWLGQACDAAARFAWERYEADYQSKRSAAGHKGGKISKRGPQYTWANVEPYQHLTKGQQAIRLGVARKTITRIHQRHEEGRDS